MMTLILPIPMPTNAKPVKPGDQPRMSEKTMGYATKQSCCWSVAVSTTEVGWSSGYARVRTYIENSVHQSDVDIPEDTCVVSALKFQKERRSSTDSLTRLVR